MEQESAAVPAVIEVKEMAEEEEKAEEKESERKEEEREPEPKWRLLLNHQYIIMKINNHF